MSLWPNLPYEILLDIFLQFDSLTDVAQSQLVCCNWSRPAQERFYKTVTLTDNKISTAEKLIVKLSQSPHSPGRFVKSLDIQTLFYEELKQNHNVFTRLVKLCPNIEILSAQQDLDSPFYKTLQENKENLQFLTRIPQPIYDKDLQEYVGAVLAYRKTLKYLYLGDRAPTGTPKAIYTTEYNTLANRLKEFPRLENLEIRTTTNKNVFELEDLIDSCPSLRTLWITAYRSTSGSMHNRNTISDLSSIVQHPYVKKFVGDNVMLTDDSINYIMHKFPHLEDLTVKKYNEEYYAISIQQRFKLSAVVMTRFFKYISTMRYFELCSSLVEHRIPEVMDAFMKATADTNLVVKIEYSNDMDIVNYPGFDIRKASRYDIDSMGPAVDPNTNILEIGYLLNYDQTQLPHQQIINQFGGNLKDLQLSTRATQDFYTHSTTESHFHKAMLHSLNHIFSHCQKLKSLSLYDMYLLYNETKLCAINKSIEKLEIGGSAILPETLSQLSWCLPSLKYLTLTVCDFVDHDDKVFTELLILIDMPNTLFENITWKRPFQQTPPKYKCLVCIVDQSGKECYFMGDPDNLYLSSSEEFNQKTEKYNSNIKFKVNCKSIYSFTVELFYFRKEYLIPQDRLKCIM